MRYTHAPMRYTHDFPMVQIPAGLFSAAIILLCALY